MGRVGLVAASLVVAGCAAALPCKPRATDYDQPCREGDWEWLGWGSCCRARCEHGKWHRPLECVLKFCGDTGTVHFDLRSAELKTGHAEALAQRLSRISGTYRVVGYADPLERDEVPGLDLRRARALRDALTDAGVCEEALRPAEGGGILLLPETPSARPWAGVATVVSVPDEVRTRAGGIIE